MDELVRPPQGWPQRAGRSVPFPAGEAGDEWEIVGDREPGMEWGEYHVRHTGEVFRRDEKGFYQPTWSALPIIVRRAVMRAMGL